MYLHMSRNILSLLPQVSFLLWPLEWIKKYKDPISMYSVTIDNLGGFVHAPKNKITARTDIWISFICNSQKSSSIKLSSGFIVFWNQRQTISHYYPRKRATHPTLAETFKIILKTKQKPSTAVKGIYHLDVGDGWRARHAQRKMEVVQ